MTNFADAECRTDYFAERPEPDHPSPSELIDDYETGPVSHCGHCSFFGRDRCGNGAYLDEHWLDRNKGWICPSDTDKEIA